MSTMKDVARKAGVGVGTVSRYLNGFVLKTQTTEKVQKAILALDYHVNTVAQGLKTDKTFMVGVLIPDFSDIYGTTMVKYLERGLSRQGYNLLVCDSANNTAEEKEKIKQLLQRRIDGLILYPASPDIAYLNNLPNLHIPIITVDVKTHGYPCDQVLTDNKAATMDATMHLLQLGHRRIGLISGKEGYFTAEERKEGYIAALQNADISVDKDLIAMTTHYDADGAKMAMHRFMALDKPVTAVIACNYYTTLGVMQTVYDQDIDVPGKLSVIGFDNLGLSQMTRPPITIVSQPMEEIGIYAADLLIARMQGKWTDFPILNQQKATLQIRQSTSVLEHDVDGYIK